MFKTSKKFDLEEKLELPRALLYLYYKKDFKSFKGYLCILISIIPVLFTYFQIKGILDWEIEITQSVINLGVFWNSYIFQVIQFGIFIPIILSCNIISGDFSRKTAMTIYSIIPSKAYLISNIFFILIHLAFLELISMVSIGIMVLVLMNRVVSINILLIGYGYSFIFLTFFLAFTFILSTLTKNTIIAVIIPILYINIEFLFIQYDMELLSYRYYSDVLANFIQNAFLNTQYIIDSNKALSSLIIFLSVPLILFIISIYGFQQLDIRTS